jgi:Fe-S-cluster-containing hydrogenase component 2
MLACSFVHEDVYDLSLSRIRIERNAERSEGSPKVCVQCDDAFCIAACPVSALTCNPVTGAIQLDEETCIGCKRCVGACPYEGVGFREDAKLPIFCDLCGGDPTCVGFCRFPQAIAFVVPGEEAE